MASFKDEEVRAMSSIVQAMEPLDEDGQVRVAVYIVDRFAPALVNKASHPLGCSAPNVAHGGPTSAA